ncbi:hypothetical protein LCGC14_0556560 [marine sediment metagenome]|uniref:Uncharacterized protein n=1 Tax=marine sediment metagenome TaxID=412755 RepID=A0A0F9UWI9_9ZZZZ
MTRKDLELEKLRDWFNEKYTLKCYQEARKELNKRKNWQSWWKRITINEEERSWLIKRTRDILNKFWEDNSK